MAEEMKKLSMPHSIVLEDKSRLSVTGVSDVESFDEQTITAYTDFGELTIKGNELNICKLNIQTGELEVEGKISSLAYTDSVPKAAGFFGRVFR